MLTISAEKYTAVDEGYVAGTSTFYQQSIDCQVSAEAEKFILENQSGAATLKAKRRIGKAHPIEEVGARLRDMMPWIKASKLVDRSKN